ncbi:hypothetical protein Lesp02_80340 [Lentzea sp. NBRC 105346]|uniref:hypothetical protein n=1 Tax=Lentzea sp. NBRC 105346 TaxID=3032205 RepID=UPI0024A3ACD0|nr:hypothetical protein [Lentzea sp. NBRC 105346]GLZ35847.1 hypothetical protein Lesp02_80340 [Lentzea sp. NBRC 105346]
MGEDGWWYCLTHNTVENTRRCRGADRLGPYPDRESAERALELAREKTKAADEADRKWRGDDDD